MRWCVQKVLKILDEDIISEDDFWLKLKFQLTSEFYRGHGESRGECVRSRDLCPQNILHGKWPQRICVKLGRDGLACIKFHFNKTNLFGPDDGNFSTGYFKYKDFPLAAEVIEKTFEK
eukprot:GHVP01034746.1.p1 GENE.GHVP01034746.1~~GHVP01034746.1.p1  ORF type:complete len:118 (+),score=14.45 GHVP01034746.1:465-818(+)